MSMFASESGVQQKEKEKCGNARQDEAGQEKIRRENKVMQ